MAHTVMSSFCLCSEPIYYVEQKIKKIYPTSQPDMSVDIPTQVNGLSLYLLNLHRCTVRVFQLTRAFMCGIIATRMACGQIYLKK